MVFQRGHVNTLHNLLLLLLLKLFTLKPPKSKSKAISYYWINVISSCSTTLLNSLSSHLQVMNPHRTAVPCLHDRVISALKINSSAIHKAEPTFLQNLIPSLYCQHLSALSDQYISIAHHSLFPTSLKEYEGNLIPDWSLMDFISNFLHVDKSLLSTFGYHPYHSSNISCHHISKWLLIWRDTKCKKLIISPVTDFILMVLRCGFFQFS